ncbi:PREDICTED: uncharacterized protein LOC104728786 [Camelina sativa]|uniref:Uncharacterized protein LOC104728786 n=1 Tax=Camelina sativa TaxID=90675 RepID=A0ABM0UTC7_CAMSA|nr:PREDICTED: uncharacterized protein LOC104728786 [Camelina sativa]
MAPILTRSWIWRRLSKLRPLARPFVFSQIHSGTEAPFWHDNWMGLGPLLDLFGDAGPRVMGIRLLALVGDVVSQGLVQGKNTQDGIHGMTYSSRQAHNKRLTDSLESPSSFILPPLSDRHAISRWRKAQMPYGRETIEDLKSKLATAQADDTSSVEEIAGLTWQLREAYRDEEVYWFQKSRSRWMRFGDHNTSYFMPRLNNGGHEIALLGLFTSSAPSDFEEALGEIQPVITEAINEILTQDASEKEVKEALFMMYPDKARVDKPTKMTELRPISLCNVGYKVISKEMFHGLRSNPSCKGKYMAIKTDMSKAYDRVEWSFIDRLLRKFGFCDRWLSWIMWCVTSVQYKVLLNGEPHGSIIPHRGLQQGDPLSPYLFILCTEVLIANLRKAEQSKLITGIMVSTACPTISHLLFADNSLFSVAPRRNNVELSYEFSSSMSGFPDRLQARAGGWPARLLSKGGKEVMIKSVATAVPTFVMSYFRLPKTVTQKLTSAISNFWWSSSDQSQELHWVAWDRLCLTKSEGGLGFRCLDDYNTALLAKQFWRLITVPESLFARVFKGRYYRHSDPMDPIKSYSPSYGWRSMVSARSLVNKGLITRVGSGASISVWTDPWIPAQFPRPAISSGLPLTPSLRVNSFVERTTNSWDMALLSAAFVPKDVAIISAIPLGTPTSSDMLGWHFTKSGTYSVKSGYHILRQATTSRTICGPDITLLQAFVWKIRCPPKIRHFFWQAITGCIAVTSNLRKRGLSCDTTCAFCGFPVETINHVLFECSPARQVWALSSFPTGPDAFPTASIYANMDFLFWRAKQSPTPDVYPWILWYIWKARNDKVFSNLDSNPLALSRIAEEESQAWFRAQLDDPVDVPVGAQHVTHSDRCRMVVARPALGCLCFVDGSWKATDKYVGRGWFCTSSGEEAPTMGAANLRRSLTPLHAEMEALIWAMRCMISADNQDVVFLTDCSDLVKMVSSPSEWPAFKPYFEEIQADRKEFHSFSLALVPRAQNSKADNLARRVRTVSHPATFVNNIPSHWLF